MLKLKNLIFLILLLPFLIYSQVNEIEEKIDDHDKIPEGLNYDGMVSTNLAQTALKNWSAGGNNSIAISGATNWNIRYKKGKNILMNMIDVRYGLVKQGEDRVKKTDDIIELTSKYGREAASNWYYSGLLNFKTQMANGKNDMRTKISAPFAPAYLTTAIGMDWRKYSSFSLFISPVTSKVTFVWDDELSNQGSFGVESGQKSRHELGGYLRAQYRREIMKNVTLDNKLDMFANYNKNWKNIDIKYDLLLNMKVNKYISANFSANFIYDKDIDTNGKVFNLSGLQLKESIGVGFSYNFK